MAENITENPGTSLNLGVEAQPDQPAVQAAEKAKKTPDKGGFYWGLGRRKSSVARVRIRPGDGKMLINKRELDNYFPRKQDRILVKAPLATAEAEGKFDIFINVRGGGITGQAGASRLGIARALKNYDEKYLQALRDGGQLTRDARMVERKKPGQKKARKKFQFSKR